MTISLCMIVKDEEETLARCLDGIKDCVDEIVIADTGSADNTREIAARYTDRLYSYPWADDFAAARNFALSRATGDYLLWLDADDFVSPENAERLIALKDALAESAPDLVYCPYDVGFDRGGSPTLTYYRERILRREAGFRFVGRVHECVPPRGKTMRSEFRVLHLGSKKERGPRNLRIYERWAGEEKLGGRDLFYYGRELYYNRLYTAAIAVLEEMIGGDGWYVNKIEACKILALCFLARGENDRAADALTKSFLYGEPRASVLCELAKIFQTQERWAEAAFWYEGALNCRDHAEEGDFEEPACRGEIPLLSLVVCRYAAGDEAGAKKWHAVSKERFPNHPSVRFNEKFFGD